MNTDLLSSVGLWARRSGCRESGDPAGRFGQAERVSTNAKTSGSSVFLKLDWDGNEHFFMYFDRLTILKNWLWPIEMFGCIGLQYFVSIRSAPSWLQILPSFFFFFLKKRWIRIVVPSCKIKKKKPIKIKNVSSNAFHSIFLLFMLLGKWSEFAFGLTCLGFESAFWGGKLQYLVVTLHGSHPADNVIVIQTSANYIVFALDDLAR